MHTEAAARRLTLRVPCAPGVISVKSDVTAIWGLLTSSYLNMLLLSVPLGYTAHALNWAPLLRFSLVSTRNCAAMQALVNTTMHRDMPIVSSRSDGFLVCLELHFDTLAAQTAACIRRNAVCPGRVLTADCTPRAQNFLSLVPLALLLGEVTEDLAVRFGDTIGGLLNATFGNVVELILSIAALQKGLYDVVATSLIGSVLSNLLLVLGALPVHQARL